MTKSISYADAGVSIDNANLAVAKIREYARSTFNERTLTEIGSFGGMFSAAFPQMAEPILVASADGVGTKLKLAFETGIHNTVGADLVNHCVNDILVQGARPLFFLDYFATGKLEPDTTATVGDALLATHQSFLPQIGPLLDSGVIKGLAHITGGGFLENIPRILPEGVSVEINRGTWPELPIFGLMQRLGNVDDHEMFRTFN